MKTSARYTKTPRKHASLRLPAVLMAFSCLTHPAQAQVLTDGGTNLNVYTAPNGVPVVDIATPNAQGLSHNTYNHYNVDNRGLVLNNGDSSEMARQSQLAGQVVANLNLVPGQQATLILNEVTSTNRTNLNGFTEVLGGTADVVVANPNGITCNGCGFLNTPNVTLSTGTPTLSGGNLSTLGVARGDILVTGTGANATNQEYLALVARKIKIEGPINAANELDIVAGANTWSHTGRTASANSPTGDTPDYAVDSTALGGMYANKIRVIATEAGVGVRMRGDVAASGTDFTITAAGKVELTSNKVSANRDIVVNTTSNIANAIAFSDASLASQRDTILTATGGHNYSGSSIVSVNDLTINGASLTDEYSATAITDNNKRYAANALLINITGAGAVNGTNWGAGNGFTGNFGSFTAGALGGKLYSSTILDMTTSTGVMLLKTMYLESVDDMTLTAEGFMSTEAGESQGIRVTDGDLEIYGHDSMTNAGTITTDTGSVDLNVSGTLTNSGTIHSKNDMTFTNYVGGSSEDIVNSGTIISEDVTTIHADDITNSGTWQSRQSATTATSLTNSGTIIASTGSGTSTFNLTTLTNQVAGILQAANNLALTITTALTNSGKIISADDVNIRSHGFSGTTVTNNSGGVIQAADRLEIQGYAGTGMFMTISSNAGTMIAEDVNILAATASNSGTIQANDDLTMEMQTSATNSGLLLAKDTATITIPTFTNSGTLQANKGLTYNGTSVTNSGNIIGSTDGSYDGSLTVSTLTNESAGIIQAARDLTLNVMTSIANAGKMLASDDLRIAGRSAGTDLSITNSADAIIQATNLLGITGFSSGSSANITSNLGTMLANQLGFNLKTLSNGATGVIQGGTSASNAITAATSISNVSGAKLILSTGSGDGTITTPSLTNAGTLQSGDAMALNIGTIFTNSGSTLAGGNLTIRGTSNSMYDVTNSSRVQSGGLLSVRGYNDTRNVDMTTTGSTALYLGDTLDILADDLTLSNSTTLTSLGNATIDVDDLTFGGTSAAIVLATSGSGTGTITFQNAETNNAAIHSGYDLVINAPGFTNSSTGGVSALNDLTITATGSNNVVNTGAFYAGRDLSVIASGDTVTNSGFTGTMDAGRDISITASTINNYNDLNATRNITLTGATIRNSVVGGDNRLWNNDQNDFDENQTGYDSDGWPDNEQWWYYEATWYTYQYYNGGKPSDKPNMIAGGTMTWQNFDVAENIGGNLVANTITFTGNGGATFTNNAMAIIRRDYEATYNDYENCNIFGLDCDFYNNENYSEIIASTTTLDSVGASIRANTFNGGGFGLTNDGSPYAASVNSSSASGGSSTSLTGGASATTGANGASGSSVVGGANTVSFGGLSITLPTNPNGYFVPTVDNNSNYLVETNSRFSVGSNFTGSDFMAKRLGINPDDMQKRLGDANYEGYLIRQQLMDQTGRNLLSNAESEAQQMERLMSSGADQSKEMGLKLGQPLSPSQLANLKEDMVWMVEVEVKGQKVLTPVVYLSAKTKSMFGDSGDATISAGNMDLNLDSVKNNGGTISADDSMKIQSKGDITNTSGKITSGGDMSLKSTGGSIKNETLAETTGDSRNKQTVVGKGAEIKAGGDLSLDAKKDVTNLGANMGAGGNADIKAGGDVTFDTIKEESTRTRTTGTRVSALGGAVGIGSLTTSTTSSTNNIGSNLTVGGNLKVDSGKDTTIGGSNVTTGGSADIKTGGQLKVESREDAQSSSKNTESAGMFFSSSGEGKSQGTTTNKASNLNIGGDLKTDSKGDTTIKGSNVNVDGSADIKTGGNLNILDGKNTKTSTESRSESGIGKGGSGSIYGSETETNEKMKQDSVGSNIKVGGNLKTDSKGDTTVKGSNVDASGKVDMKTGGDMKILAGENLESEKNTVTKSGVGFMGSDSGSSSGSDSEAGAKKNLLGGASAGASGSAEAEGEARLTLQRTVTETTATTSKTHTGSSIKSGGDMSLDAGKDMKVVGSDIEAGGNAELKAGKNMTFEEAKDTTETTNSRKVQESGLYADGGASASGEASAKAVAGQAKAGAGGEASAEGSVGLYVETREESNTEGSSTARVSTIKSGGDMSRKAGEKMTDVGTNIEAGGNYSQEAKEIDNKAAKNEQWSSSSSETNTGKIGVYAEAGAEAGAKGSTHEGANPEAKAGVSASAGVKASYERSTSDESSNSSQAVAGSIKAGGNVNSKSSGKTTFEGTNIEAGGDGNIEAGSLEFKAAKDTEKSSASASDVNAELKVGYGASAEASTKGGAEAKKGLTGSIAGGYQASSENSESSKAVVGSMKTGGNMNIKTKGDSTFEGTNLEAGKDANISSDEGSVNFKAARDTEKSSASEAGFQAELSMDKMDGDLTGGASVDINASSEKSESSKAVTGSIKSGGNTNINAKKDVNAEGTKFNSGGDTSIEAKEGDINITAAKSTSSSSSSDVSVGLSGEVVKGAKKEDGTRDREKRGGLEVGASFEDENSVSNETGSINSGGNVTLKSGKNTKLEGTDVAADGKVKVDAGGKLIQKDVIDSSSKTGVDLDFSAGSNKNEGVYGGVDVNGESSSSRKSGSISGSDVEIKTGR